MVEDTCLVSRKGEGGWRAPTLACLPSNSCQFVVTMVNCTLSFHRYAERKEDEDEWSSPYFLTHPNGYKLCLNVIPNGVGDGDGTHISTSLWLSVDQHPNLTWPLYATVKIELLNQLKDDGHRSVVEDICEEPEPTIDGFNSEYVSETLISHVELGLNLDSGTQFLKDDCLYFRISVELPEDLHKPWLHNIVGKSSHLISDY